MLEKVCKQIDDFKHPKKIVWMFLILWLSINLIQSFFTELAHDEAYYWLFSRKLDWGYFDHPPMIALIVKLGYSIFQNELGVRLLPLLLGTGTIYLIYLMIEDKLSSLSTFILVISSVIILQSHVGGFLAIPDIPVIFFTSLFLYLYKKYLNHDSVILALFLGLAGAAMLYSKYHGVLVLFFTLFSNLSIFRRKSLYIVPVVITIAMLPHLFWQINNGFPTFEYHLVSRSSDYTILHTLNYLLGQILIAGPFVGIVVFYHAIRKKTDNDLFLRAMKFNFYGFFGFFFIMSFKGHVEAHWTAIGFIPVVLLSVDRIASSPKALKWLRSLFIPSILLFTLIRISLVFNILPNKYGIGAEFHNWDKWAQELKEVAKDRKVVFVGSFQRPAKYSFYTNGEFAHSLNHVWYRKNQFDLWGYTDSIQGDDIILFRTGKSFDSVFTSAASENYGYRLIDDFVSYDGIPILLHEKEFICQASDSIYLSVDVVNVKDELLDLSKINNISPQFMFIYRDGAKNRGMPYLSYLDAKIQPLDTMSFNISFIAPKQKGNYLCNLSIVNNKLLPGFNSKPFHLIVE